MRRSEKITRLLPGSSSWNIPMSRAPEVDPGPTAVIISYSQAGNVYKASVGEMS